MTDLSNSQEIKKIPGINQEKIEWDISVRSWNIYCFAWLQSYQSIPNISSTYLNFNEFDTNDVQMWKINWKIKIIKTGMYLIVASVQWANSSWWVPIRNVILELNWNDIVADNSCCTNTVYNNLSMIKYLYADDIVRLKVYHDAWTSVNVLNNTTFLQVIKIL